MEDRAELAGNLKAELLDVREGLRLNQITQAQAIERVTAVRGRRLAAVLEPQQLRFFAQAAKGIRPHPELSRRQSEPYRVPIIRAADTGREI